MQESAVRRYPALGPLFGKAFDQAVKLTLERWFWLLLVTLIPVAGAPYTGWVANSAYYTALAIWGIISGAAAVGLIRPDFKMTWPRIGKLIVLDITVTFLVALASLALIIPGIYLGVMWSLARVILLLEDVGTAEARKRSWALVERHFGRTLLLATCIVLVHVVADSGIARGLAAGMGYLVQVHWFELTQKQIDSLAWALMFPLRGYIMVASWLAYIYWYRTLKAMERPQERAAEAGFAASPA